MLLNGCFKLTFIFTIYFCNIIHITNGSNILVINHIEARSHLQIFSAVIEELIPLGHNVTYLGALPYTGHLKSKVTQHRLKSDYITDNREIPMNMMRDALNPSKSTSSSNTLLTYVELYGEEPCTFLENDIITNIMNLTVTFDVLLLNSFGSECFHSIGYIKKIPIILLPTSFVLPWQYINLGVDPYFGIEVTYTSDYSQNSLIQRTIDIIDGNNVILRRYQIYSSNIDKWLLKNYPNVNFPPFHELQKNFSLIMVNTIPAMGYARSKCPTIVNIGGIHIRQPKKLPSAIEKFISAVEDKGFIYFSLGSTFPTEIIPRELLDTFLEAFKQLPYRVLMKWNASSTTMPSNVLSSPWLPQQDILGHPRLLTFVTQAGLLSLQEAASHGVPVITLPILFDQFTNSELAERLGYGIKLDIKTVTAPLLVNAIHKVINEPRFKNVARNLSSAVRDVPNTPQELVTWWTEYVIRNGGTERLRTARQRLSWYQQQQLDVLILLCSISLFIVWIFYLLVSTTNRMIRKLLQRKEKLT